MPDTQISEESPAVSDTTLPVSDNALSFSVLSGDSLVSLPDDTPVVSSVSNETASSLSTETEPRQKQESESQQSMSAYFGAGDVLQPKNGDATAEKHLPRTDEVTGALVYDYALDIPQGRNDMSPDFSLQYNSQNKENSIFGKGWTDNIPFIERTNKRGTDSLYSDNYFTSSMDGELVEVGTSNYRAKIDNGNFNSYVFQNNSWVITNKEGKVYTFGYSTSTRQDNISNGNEVYKWMVEDIRDINGNYISYGYYKDSGQIYPDTISYTHNANASSTGIYSVQFSREQRYDNPQNYISDFSIKNNYRVNQITVNVNGNWVKKYDFSYASSTSGGESLIQRIVEKGQDENNNEITLPGTEFSYQTTENKDISLDASWQFPSGIAFFDPDNGYDMGTRIADINGDSLPDIITSHLTSVTCSGHTDTLSLNHFYINTGTGWSEDTNWQMPFSRTNDCSQTVTETFTDQGEEFTGLRIADLNGDGLADLLRINKYSNGWSKQVWINKGDGTGWAEDVNWTLPNVGLWEPENNQNLDGGEIVDVNGDSLPDILQAKDDGSTFISGVYLNNGSEFIHSDSWQFPSGVAFLDSDNGYDLGTRIADINGDSLPDIITSHMTNVTCNSHTDTLSLNHFYINTGTGWSEDANWQMPFSHLNDCGQSVTATFTNPSEQFTGFRTGDLNGDGLADIYELNNYSLNNGWEKQVWLNKGGWNRMV
ncbi:MAG: FG-GAP-like repeat-containing protein [Candidatus Parcubacteria bacterium]|nr:FG-GAP-like repeat-containing protein [Candidatus Parcubacteria bacterium]